MSVHDIQMFLEMAGYYSRFVPIYVYEAAALADLLNKKAKWEWTTAAQESFE